MSPLRLLPTALLAACGASDAAKPGDTGASAEPLPLSCPVDTAPELALVDVAPELGLQRPLTANMGIAIGDPDGDGALDLLRSDGGAGLTWFEAAGDAFDGDISQPVRNLSGLSLVDYDGDGDADLHLTCGSMGESCPDRIYRNDAGTFVEDPDALAPLDHIHFTGAWADWDGDGDLDLSQPCLVPPGWGAPMTPHLYRNDGGKLVDVAGEMGLTQAGSWIRSV